MPFICCMYCRSLFLQGNTSHGHYCEGTKTRTWSEPLGRCWCSSENKVHELQGWASRGVARFCWCPDRRRTEAQRELHPKINVCMGRPGKTAGATFSHAWTEFLALWKVSDIWKQGRPQVVIGNIAQIVAWFCFWWAPGENWCWLGSRFNPAPGTELTCQCVGITQAIAGS